MLGGEMQVLNLNLNPQLMPKQIINMTQIGWNPNIRVNLEQQINFQEIKNNFVNN